LPSEIPLKKPIRIVIVADTPRCVLKIHQQLRRARVSFYLRLIDNREALIDELDCHHPDAILSSCRQRSFDGQAALSIASQKRPDVPFIFVTASEEEVDIGPAPGRHTNQNVSNSSVSKLACTVRQAVRQARERIKLRDLVLQSLTARWAAR
jgi:CheY-like chemotaxis protein